jgi:hypothetical protein
MGRNHHIWKVAIAMPKILGQPTVSFVGSFSADMYGEVNPENAQTEYFFEYAEESLLATCKEGTKGTVGCHVRRIEP